MKRPSLRTQVLAVNALLISATVFAASIVVNLHDVSLLESRRFMVLVAAIMATFLVNSLVLRRRFEPLEQLISALESIDFTRGRRVPEPTANVEELTRLQHAFDRMLARLDVERDRRAGAVLRAQESERARLARDLHDEANQALTGVLLRLEATAQHAPRELRAELRATKALATQAVEELLSLARELRPAALDDLGLGAALRTKVDEFSRRATVKTRLELPVSGVDDLDLDQQLVVYRVVQEGLTNVARHSGAENVVVSVERDEARTLVRVVDDGDGFDPWASSGGMGLSGMRERAALAGGRIDVRSRPGSGTAVELVLGSAP